MCGISGIHRRANNEVDHALLQKMADSILHRGPDDSGFLQLPGIGFAFRRLSIIDLEGGDQPIRGCDGGVIVQGNGEIYNFRELRSELVGLGHRFSTNSDVEVIVHGYEEWGVDVVHHLNGMFAFAIWDSSRRRLVVARDHLGIKPLYYRETTDGVRFGSEMRAILADPTLSRELDHDALRLFLHFGYTPSPHTLVKGVKKLAPGHLFISDESGLKVTRYWEPRPEINQDITLEEATEEYQRLVSEAVKRQMVSDVPIGILLSGGVDSAMILEAATNEGGQQLQTFTVGFEDQFDHDESDDAAETARLLGAEHHKITLAESDFGSVVEQTLWHLEEPVLSQSTFAYHLMTREVRRHLKVVLTGQGADEPWAGYDRYIGERYGGAARMLFRSSAMKVASNKLPMGPRLGRAAASLGEADPVKRFAAIHQVFSPEEIRATARGDVLASDATAEDAIRYWQEPVNYLDQFSQLLHVDTRMSLPDDLLLYGDKLSMSNSVEARVPFLDIELIKFVETLPPSFKLRGRTGKYVHKRAAERALPREIVRRPKKGFATPVDKWFAQNFAPALERTVLGEGSLCLEILDRSALSNLIDDHVSGKQNHRRQLTTLLSLELAGRQLLGQSESSDIAEPFLNSGAFS